MHAKSSKPPTTFQWDAVDTSPDLWGQNVLRTVEMAIRHKRRTTRTASERESSVAGLFSLTFKNIFWPSWQIRHWKEPVLCALTRLTGHCYYKVN